jgi:hypothetical protein
MGAERRRTGFRLPWAGEGEEAEGGQTEADVEVDELTPSNGSAVPASDQAPSPDTTAAPAAAPASAEPMTSDADSAEFLANLVGAMRGVAETSRDASLSELRTAIEARIETLGTQGTEQETELRRQADVDLEGVGEWERTEVERVRAEAERKRDARRRKLEDQLTERRTATERQIEATRSRMADHERDLAAFFAQLAEITDPAAFVSAAKRMPHAPELDDTTEAATTAGADDPRLAALAMPAAGEQASSPTPEQAPVEATTEATAETATEPTQAAAEPVAETVPQTSAEVQAEAPAADASPHDAQLAERLAQLDERLSGATQPVTASAPSSPATNGGETSTAIVVKGLGSFGAITSFKQALERVEGVRGVTLSLGPTGEFVYRASHAGDFDLPAAIQSIEGPTATIEENDGTLIVTLSRTR